MKAVVIAIGILSVGTVSASYGEQSVGQKGVDGTVPHQNETIHDVTDSNLPGERFVLGQVDSIRSEWIRINIGQPKLLYAPVKRGKDKGLQFEAGDPIVVTLNEQNAIVDYHHPTDVPEHKVIFGQLNTPLTVGLDKAVIGTESGDQTFYVASHIRAKFESLPLGAPLIFLADERGKLVDVYFRSDQALKGSAKLNKQPLKGAHRRLPVQYLGKTEDERIRVKVNGQKTEQILGIRSPLDKLDALKAGQDVVLLIDDQNYVIEVATPDVPPR